MPVDLSNPSGFNEFWKNTVDQFRTEAIDDHTGSGGDLEPIEYHHTGPVSESQLRAQNAYPWVWSVPQTHTPSYATINTDQGELQMQIVVFAQDTDPQSAFDKARALLGRIVNKVEGSALVDSNGNAQAAQVRLDTFDMDSGVSPGGSSRAQTRAGMAIFNIEIERSY